jgi:hypothetical protein
MRERKKSSLPIHAPPLAIDDASSRSIDKAWGHVIDGEYYKARTIIKNYGEI